MKKPLVQSVHRALTMLDTLAEEALRGRSVALQDLASRAGLAETTAHNILKTMSDCGYVEQDPDRRYRPGPKARALPRASAVAALAEAASPAVLALARRTGESVTLSALVSGRRHTAVHAQGGCVVRVSEDVESKQGFYSFVTGRALAAFAPAEELDAIVRENGLPGEAWDNIGSREKLEEALAEIRRLGRAEKRTADIAAVAVPVPLREGTVSASVGLYLPLFRATASRMKELLAELRRTAEEIAAAE
ncbi:MAG TPA: IclR family transcriptional regulator [Candidatus Brocadiia bacterium]|nr:IclR family transcriptional regulator [Candidatus Brocadiia bacterium]